MPANSNEYTHGGSAGKNVGFLFRAILNTVSFAFLWFCVYLVTAPNPFILLSSTITTVLFGVACGLLVLLLCINLFGPFIHRKK